MPSAPYQLGGGDMASEPYHSLGGVMAETANIASVAVQVSDDIFSTFGWKAVGPTDVNWECTTPEHPESTTPKTHPADVVFEYVDPYEGRMVYVHTDLKSYAKDSINAAKVGGALSKLSRSTDCTRRSADWQKRFVQPGVAWKSVGMLFIFNHDNEYDASFGKILEQQDEKAVQVAKGCRLFVFGPEDVRFLATLSNDIKVLRGDGKLPAKKYCFFNYPHLFNVRASHPHSSCATIETLLGPWVLLGYSVDPKASDSRGGCIVYMRGKGEAVDEFRYLFDYLFRFQLVDEIRTIQVRMPYASDQARIQFEHAKESYAAALPGNEQVRDLLNHVSFKVPTSIVSHYRIETLGMDRG